MITIFGASVTQQKNGYAVKLKSKFNEEVRIFGYGGMHLNNAGICFIDKVLEKDPSYCFIDWFSTGYTLINEKTIEYIDTIIYRFSQKQCKLIFLIFPSRDYSEKISFYRFCKSHLETKSICYIDINDEIGSITDILRDEIHTTDYGSTKYSDIIYSYFMKNKNSITVPNDIRPTKYLNINKIAVNRTFNKSIELEGSCEIIGFLLTIGPHSGLVELIEDKTSQVFNTWDPWCHYERKHFNLPCSIEGKIRINILQDNFDTSNCRRRYDFTKIKKTLIVHDIYYIGQYLTINNLSSGISINETNFLNGFLRKVFRRIKQIKNVILDFNRKSSDHIESPNFTIWRWRHQISQEGDFPLGKRGRLKSSTLKRPR